MIRKYTSVSGMTISVGKNAEGNDMLYRNAMPYDIWLHLKDVSSPHAILHISDKNVADLKSIRYAAQLVKMHSKSKFRNNVNVIYCYVENLIPTNTPGMVSMIATPICINV